MTNAMITNAQTDTTTLINTGDYAPYFKCTLTNGKIFDLNEAKGKVIMINFFATWCPPCNTELPVLQKEIWEKHKNNKDFVLLVLGREHTDKELLDFAGKKGLKLPFGSDKDRKIYSLFATQYIPRNVIIDRDGKVIFQNRGYAEEEFKQIEILLDDKLK
jgi:peroxiredoxin